MKKTVIFSIKLYQKFISPLIDAVFGQANTCRYQPTCSEYMIEAIRKYGALKGVGMGLKRIARCNPYHKGGFDPVS